MGFLEEVVTLHGGTSTLFKLQGLMSHAIRVPMTVFREQQTA